MILICDIDGTIACDRARFKLAGPKPAQEDIASMRAWLKKLQPEAAIKQDPSTPIMELVNTLTQHLDADLHFVTGRGEEYQSATSAWLKKNHGPNFQLYMRKTEDWRPAAAVKEEIMKSIIRDTKEQVVVIDDDPDGSCAPMYARNGWLFLKVVRPPDAK